MFTVSGRVINELVELTCAINFSLLFRFEARAQNAKQPKLSRWLEGKERKSEGELRTLPPICLQMIISTTFLLMFKNVYPPASSTFPSSHSNTGEVMKYGNVFGPPD